ncbi:unnamed protein product [Bursaphelenchus xylophilus]|uniref:(pine wood nematode) hypothetical protein n=1 Tax=Bursaphelenchus xylophilus TaxID=6326 RepID=A0A1I7RH56_BURXY|nr:unnamed protein product [Bursaphelenchus xylophilus]CAG9115968.1 unnamed protein product [Bursaphelenchus xylophilus]
MEYHNDSASSDGTVILVVAAIGLFSAFTLIICFLAIAKRRERAENQIDNFQRIISPARMPPPPPRFSTLDQNPRPPTSIPIDPNIFIINSKYDFRPPSYEEAVQSTSMTIAVNATLDVRSPTGRAHSPPPAFSENDPLPRASLSAPACHELVNKLNSSPEGISGSLRSSNSRS